MQSASDMTTVNVPGVGTVRFPAGMSQADMAQAIQKNFPDIHKVMDVRLPDGTLLKGVPEGMTREQIAQKLRANGRQVPDEWLAAKAPSAAAEWGSALVRPLAKGVAALPLMAMDAGVATRNIVGDAANKVLGKPATPDYELPSSMFNTALDAVTIAPKGPVGKAAEFVSSSLVGGKLGVPEVPAITRSVASSVSAARSAGYVVPPTQANPSLLNQVAEGLGGKVKTAQVASLKNQPVTNALVRRALGMKADEPITVAALNQVRSQAGKGYEAIKRVRDIPTDEAYAAELSAIGRKYGANVGKFGRSGEHPVNALVGRLQNVKDFDGEEAINEIGLLRDEAEKAAAARDRGLSTALRKAATAIEDNIQRHLDSGEYSADLVKNFRRSRETIAKTYSVQKALNRASGDVDASKLARQLDSDKPLTGELRQVAEFAGAHPKATQLPSRMGSVTNLSPLDFAVMGMEGAAGLTAAIASGNAKAAAGAAAAMAMQAARPAVRSAMLSRSGQRLATEGFPRAAAATKRLTLSGLQQAETAQ